MPLASGQQVNSSNSWSFESVLAEDGVCVRFLGAREGQGFDRGGKAVTFIPLSDSFG